MTKSDLISVLARRHKSLSQDDVVMAVDAILERITLALADGGRVEVRNFGVFSSRYRAARTGRNPKSGDEVEIPAKYTPAFKPGKALSQRVKE